jgi:hypothetical protein
MNRVDLQSLQSIRDYDYQDTVWEETKEKLGKALNKLYSDIDDEILRLLSEGADLKDIIYKEPSLTIDQDTYNATLTAFIGRL